MEIFLMLAMVALHVFLVMRFFAHAKDVHDHTLVPASVLGELLGVLGLALMALIILAVWGGVLLTVYYWFRGSNLDSLYIVIGALMVSPVVHLVAEFLVNVSYTDG